MDSRQLERTLSRFVRRYLADHHINFNDLDDYMNLARLAAYYAIQTYKTNKATKLKTYILNCVRNRLLDTIKREKSRFFSERVSLVDPILAPRRSKAAAIAYHNAFGEDESAGFEHDADMRSILTDREYFVYRKVFVEGFSQAEIVRQKLMSEREVQSCFTRFSRKCIAYVGSQSRASMSEPHASASEKSLLN